MAKTHRIDIRLNDADHALLVKRAHEFGGNMTEAIESLLHSIRPVAILGVKNVGKRGRVRFSLRFSNGMVVHGFLWSRGGQLLGPSVFDKGHWHRIVNGPRRFWRDVRSLCEESLTPRQATPPEEVPIEAPEQESLVTSHGEPKSP